MLASSLWRSLADELSAVLMLSVDGVPLAGKLQAQQGIQQ
jgi:hypothetical protein